MGCGGGGDIGDGVVALDVAVGGAGEKATRFLGVMGGEVVDYLGPEGW